MSGSAKPGLLSGLPNPAALRKTQPLAPVVVSPEAELALGLATAPAAAAPAPLPPPPVQAVAAAAAPAPAPQMANNEPEKSKTFFLPYTVCERLELQKLSERREMKYILRQALQEYFDRNPLRPGIQDLYK